MIRQFAFLACALLVGSGAVAHEAHLKQLRVVHPYTIAAVAAPAGGPSSAAILMTIINAGEDDDLVGAASKLSSVTRLMNGADAAEKIRIGARSETALSKEGAHIEIGGLKEGLVPYQSFPLMLEFEKAGRIKVEVLVEDPDDKPAGHHQ